MNHTKGSVFEDSSSTPITSTSQEELLPKTIKTTTFTSNKDKNVEEAPSNNEEEEEEESGNVSRGGRKLTSIVWNYFDRENIKGEMKAVCKGCKKTLVGKSSSGTTHLKEHTSRCAKVKKTLDVKQQLLQASINKGAKATLKMGKANSNFDPQISRNELSNMVVWHEYPLAMVDHIGFRRYSNSLNPDFKVISRNTLKSDILKDFKEERSHLMKQLARLDCRVAITTDMWTCSNQRKGYMAVTAHFIDDDWILQNRLIRLKSKVGKRGKNKFKLPSKEEWKMTSQICDKLGLFKRTTDAFSRTNYPTANLYFEKICAIRLELRDWSTCGNKLIEQMAINMIVKFDKYWHTINKILSVASVLDPRKKMDCISVFFGVLYGEDSEYETQKVRDVLLDLVRDYELDHFDSEPSPISFPSSIVNDKGKRPMVEANNYENLWVNHVSTEPLKKPCRCEVELYLEEPRIVVDESKFNLLVWWNIESSKYPILSRIARDILAVPISSVASESALSKGGRVVGPHRSRLLPNTVEALMCLQSWRHGHFKDIVKENKLGCALIYEDEDVEVENG